MRWDRKEQKKKRKQPEKMKKSVAKYVRSSAHR